MKLENDFSAQTFTYHCSKQTINSPQDKRKIDKKIFAAPNNQIQKTGTIKDMVADLTRGHEVIPVQFVKDEQGVVRRSDKCWDCQQVIFLDHDHGIEQATLPKFADARPFIRDNAAFVLETLRSRYDDPTDDECNGQLRLRSGYLSPERITDADVRRRVGEALCDEIPCAERGHAKRITAGGFGRVDGEVHWLNNTLSEEWFAKTLKQIEVELEAEDAQRAQQQAEQERRRQESNERSQREDEFPITALGKTHPDFYLSSLAEKPLTFQNKNASGWDQWRRLGEVKATCSQTAEGYWYVTIFAETIASPVHNESSTSTSQPSGPTPDGRFDIYTTDVPIHKIQRRVHSHWQTLHDDSVFVRGGSLCRIVKHTGKIEMFNDDTFHLWLSQRFAFWKLNKKSRKLEPLGLIPLRIIRPLLRDVPDFVPHINAIYQHPIVLPGGSVATDSGYIPEIEAWLNCDWTGWDDLDASDEGVEAAKSLLLDDLLHDFIWEDEASRANFLAYLLTFPMRPAIGGYVPMLAVTAPVQGSGKTLLLDLAHIIWQGRQALATQVGSDDRSEREEMRKRMTALLMQAPESVVFDNATRAFDNAALASALTTGRYQDRVLGESVNVELDVRTIFAATGNHLKFEGDMPRRVYWCRLGVNQEKPEERKGFKHPRLIKWTTENKDALMAACLTLIKAWIEKDMPINEDIVWGSYEEWAETMGGILHSGDIEGFLVSQADTDSEELVAMRDFCAAVYEKKKTELWTTADVFLIASHDDDNDDMDAGILDSWLGSGKNQSRKTRLGLFLSERNGRYFGDFQLLKSDKKQRGATLFVVQPVEMMDKDDKHQNEAARDDTDRSNASSIPSSESAENCSDSEQSTRSALSPRSQSANAELSALIVDVIREKADGMDKYQIRLQLIDEGMRREKASIILIEPILKELVDSGAIVHKTDGKFYPSPHLSDDSAPESQGDGQDIEDEQIPQIKNHLLDFIESAPLGLDIQQLHDKLTAMEVETTTASIETILEALIAGNTVMKDPAGKYKPYDRQF